jgi:hypothetical protein
MLELKHSHRIDGIPEDRYAFIVARVSCCLQPDISMPRERVEECVSLQISEHNALKTINLLYLSQCKNVRRL